LLRPRSHGEKHTSHKQRPRQSSYFHFSVPPVSSFLHVYQLAAFSWVPSSWNSTKLRQKHELIHQNPQQRPGARGDRFPPGRRSESPSSSRSGLDRAAPHAADPLPESPPALPELESQRFGPPDL